MQIVDDARIEEAEAFIASADLLLRRAAFARQRWDDAQGVSFERAAVVLGVSASYVRRLAHDPFSDWLEPAPRGVTRESLEREVARRGIELAA